MRRWGVHHDGEGIWWSALARNKRSVALDLRRPEAREVVRRLARGADILIENFRPGRLEGWELDYASLAALNARLILVRISGFGQTGPRAHHAGFGSVAEAAGGVRYTTGDPDRRPSRTGISLGDSLAALFAVIGALAAVVERERSGRGQVVDAAIAEAVLAVMESTVADYLLAGVVRQRTGGILPGVAPSNAYPTADGALVVIAGNADSVFRRLCAAMGRPELADELQFADHRARGVNMAELDRHIEAWTGGLDSAEVLRVLEEHGVPAGRIATAADIAADDHFRAREMVRYLPRNGGTAMPMTGVVPRLTRTPGTVRAAGPRLGEHTIAVLTEEADLSGAEIEALLRSGAAADLGGAPLAEPIPEPVVE
jgi:formyl-CoA transferase/succinyl-CoA--D-citramalate CoA-transferase